MMKWLVRLCACLDFYLSGRGSNPNKANLWIGRCFTIAFTTGPGFKSHLSKHVHWVVVPKGYHWRVPEVTTTPLSYRRHIDAFFRLHHL